MWYKMRPYKFANSCYRVVLVHRWSRCLLLTFIIVCFMMLYIIMVIVLGLNHSEKHSKWLQWNYQVLNKSTVDVSQAVVEASDIFLLNNQTGELLWNISPFEHLKKPKARDNRQAVLNKTLDDADPTLPVLEQKWLDKHEVLARDRLDHLHSVCDTYQVGIRKGKTTSRPGVPLEQINANHYITMPLLNATMCFIPKVATTSLMSTFLRVLKVGVPAAGDNVTTIHALGKTLCPVPVDLADKLRTTLAFLVVRHPLRRLISAFEDKVLTPAARASERRLLQLSLLLRYEQAVFHRNRTVRLRRGEAPAQVERDYRRAVQAYRQQVLRRRGVPTFHEFVVAAVGTRHLEDPHWTPYWRRCAPCHVPYNLMVQLEDDEQMTFLWKSLKLYHWVSLPRLHQSGRPPRRLQELADQYLRPLDTPTMLLLRQQYKLDFDLFGYDWRALMIMSGHCPSRNGACLLW